MTQIGETVGNYRLLEDLASGSFGSVYRGTHAVLTNRIVAVKLMHSTHLNSQQERETFFHEAKLLEKLEHPNILRIFDVGVHNGTPYIVTAYAPGGSLRQHLKRQAGKPLVFIEALKILWQIAQALDHAHSQNVIHRDLKPENILFDVQGTILLADFGLSSFLGTHSVHQTTPSGTPAYMAPEQFKGEVSRESDQYALGCIAYELFTGQKPFAAPDFIALGFKHTTEQATPPRNLNSNLPEYTEQAILRALAKERKQRFSSVLAFVTALQKPPKTSQQWFDEGKQHFKDKQYEKALVAYDQALLLNPTFDSACNNKGLALIELRRYEEALQALEQAILLNSNLAAAYGNRGHALLGLDRCEEALQALEQAIALDPSNFHFYCNKCFALRTLNRYEEVLKVYEQFILIEPNSAVMYCYKGRALDHLERYEEALQAYEQAILLDPNFVCPFELWSDIFNRLKKLQAWEQSILLNPNNHRAYYEKGIVLNNLNKYEEALLAFEQAIRLDPNDVFAYHNKGHILNKLNRYEEALQAFEQAILLCPVMPVFYRHKGIVLNKLNRYEEALQAFEQVIRLDRNDADAYSDKGLILERLGKKGEAQSAYTKARQLGYPG